VFNTKDRKPCIDLYSLDAVLLEDLRERLEAQPALAKFHVRTPAFGPGGIEVQEIHRMAAHSVKARLLIFDVRRLTLPRLQAAYNKLVGYNRADLNAACHSVLVGDGPEGFLFDGGFDLFAPLLAKLRLDYSPAAFFFDPFLHYSHEEQLPMGLDYPMEMLSRIPQRLAKYFRSSASDLPNVRRYFRASTYPLAQQPHKALQRLEHLRQMLSRRLQEFFPDQATQLLDLLGPVGYSLPGESLSVRIYPFFFEETLCRLMH
jgi:hypothetical protein